MKRSFYVEGNCFEDLFVSVFDKMENIVSPPVYKFMYRHKFLKLINLSIRAFTKTDLKNE